MNSTRIALLNNTKISMIKFKIWSNYVKKFDFSIKVFLIWQNFYLSNKLFLSFDRVIQVESNDTKNIKIRHYVSGAKKRKILNKNLQQSAKMNVRPKIVSNWIINTLMTDVLCEHMVKESNEEYTNDTVCVEGYAPQTLCKVEKLAKNDFNRCKSKNLKKNKKFIKKN